MKTMEKLTIDTPSLYGDHHVVEVRRILMELAGVEDVYASSAFRLVEVFYEPAKVSEKDINARLSEAGYTSSLTLPTESGLAVTEVGRENTFFRRTSIMETAKQAVAFQQQVVMTGKPLWNCPGFGVLKTKMEE